MLAQFAWKIKQPFYQAARKLLLGTITRVETTDRVLALTFDDGPHPEYTPRLLDILDRYHAKATFFCVGRFAANHPELIGRIAEAGHVIGIHTWDHPCLPVLGYGEQDLQIRRCAESLNCWGSRLFRPPYGALNFTTGLALLRHGYQSVGWTLASCDWQLQRSEEILGQVSPHIQSGMLLLFHDRIAISSLSATYFNREPTLEAVNCLLARLSGTYRFVTVPELLGSGHVVRECWYSSGAGHVPGIRDPELAGEP